jgi:hypothetical protein
MHLCQCAACHPGNFVDPGPNDLGHVPDARVDRYEAKTSIETEGDTNKPAVDGDDVGLRHELNPCSEAAEKVHWRSLMKTSPQVSASPKLRRMRPGTIAGLVATWRREPN